MATINLHEKMVKDQFHKVKNYEKGMLQIKYINMKY